MVVVHSATKGPTAMHQRMDAVLDKAIEDIHSIQREARKCASNDLDRSVAC